jgi:hypothetical protein
MGHTVTGLLKHLTWRGRGRSARRPPASPPPASPPPTDDRADSSGASNTRIPEAAIDWQLLDAPGESTIGEDGIISCLCVTRGSYPRLRRALDCFHSQSYPLRELVVVYETLEPRAMDLLNESDLVSFVHVPESPKQTLGALRNVAIRASLGKYVCGWDDDDWYAPSRLARQLQRLLEAGADACMLRRWLMLDEKHGRAYLSPSGYWEGSLMCRRDLSVLAEGYPPLPKDEDRVLVERLIAQHAVTGLDQPELYVYTFHGENTWDEEHFDVLYRQSDELSPEATRRLRGIVPRAT